MPRVARHSGPVVEVDGAVIRSCRTALPARLSQEALARKVGVSSSLIGHLETGYTTRVSKTIVAAIAQELGVATEVLVRSQPEAGAGIEGRLERILELLESSVPTPQVETQDTVRSSSAELTAWASDFMRENSRHAPADTYLSTPGDLHTELQQPPISLTVPLANAPIGRGGESTVEVFRGYAAVASAINRTLKRAATTSPPETDGTILFTYQGQDLYDVVDPSLRRELVESLRGALDRGWNILHLLTYGPAPGATLRVVTQSLELLGRRGHYLAKRVPDRTVSPAHVDLLIVPGQCVLQLWATEPGRPPSCAMQFAGEEVQHEMAKIFRKSDAAASDLMLTYPQHTSWLKLLEEPRRRTGERFHVKPGPLSATVPASAWRWAAKHARQRLVGGDSRQSLDVIDQFERAMIKRSRSIETLLAHTPNYDLFTRQSLDEIVHGRYDANNWLLALAQRLQRDGVVPVDLRIQHVQRILWMLHRFPLYRVAIADNDSMEEPFPRNLMSLRIPNPPLPNDAATAFVQVWPHSEDEDRTGGYFAVFREPEVTGAFHSYYDELWNDPGVVRDRDRVIEILVGALEQLERGARQSRRAPAPATN